VLEDLLELAALEEELRNAINSGLVRGPRMQVAGQSLNPRASVQTPNTAPGLFSGFTENKNINGPWLARAAVRRARRYTRFVLNHPLGLLRHRSGQLRGLRKRLDTHLPGLLGGLRLELLRLIARPTRLTHAAQHTHNGER